MGSGEGGQPPPPPPYGHTATGRTGYEGCEATRRMLSAASPAEVPWERMDHYGFFGGLLKTIKRAMFNPGPFFGSMPLPNGMLLPLLFAMLVVLFSGVVSFLWSMVILASAPPVASTLLLVLSGIGLFFALPLVLLLIFFLEFITAGILHLFLMLTKGGKCGFEATLRVTAYATAPFVLGLIPLVGFIVTPFWSLVIILVGLKHIHRTSYWQVVLAMVLSFIPMLLAYGMSLFWFLVWT
jgi:hypothetical protein